MSIEPPLKRPKLDRKRVLLPEGDFTIESVFSLGLLAQFLRFKDIESNFTLVFSGSPADGFDYVIGHGDLTNECRFNRGKGFARTYFYDRRIHRKNDKGQKTTLSCIGQVYKRYGRAIIQSIIDATPGKTVNLSEEEMKLLYDRIYFDFIEGIDAKLTGESLWAYKPHSPHPKGSPDMVAERDLKFSVKNWDLESMVQNMNLPWDAQSEIRHREQFLLAVELVMGVFRRYVRYLVFSHFGGIKYVEEKYMEMLHGKRSDGDYGDPSAMKRILVLDKFVSWKEHLHQFEYKTPGITLGHCLYAVFLDSTSGWRVCCVPVTPGSFESRKPFPAAWRGLSDTELEEACGVKDAKFVHAQGFIGGGLTLESCIRMAIGAVNDKQKL